MLHICHTWVADMPLATAWYLVVGLVSVIPMEQGLLILYVLFWYPWHPLHHWILSLIRPQHSLSNTRYLFLHLWIFLYPLLDFSMETARVYMKSAQDLLAFIVYGEKSVVILIDLPLYVTCPYSLTAF